MSTISKDLTPEQRVIFARLACRWAIDQATGLCGATEVTSRAHWSGSETPEQESERLRFAELAEKAPSRAKRICDYVTLGPDGIDLKNDKDLAEVMDQLRTDETTMLRKRKPSIEIISDWIEKAVAGEV